MKDTELQAFEVWFKEAVGVSFEEAKQRGVWDLGLIESAYKAGRAAVEADRAQRVPECRVVDVGFRFDGEAQQHVPSIKVEFEPVPVNVGSGGKGWKDRDALAALLASTPAQPAQQEPLLVLAKSLLEDWANSFVDCIEGGEADEGVAATRSAVAQIEAVLAAKHQEPPQQERKPKRHACDDPLCAVCGHPIRD